MSVQEITSAREFDRVLASHPGVAADFYATWCGPCKAFAPTFARLAASNPATAFIKIDVDRLPDLAQRFQVRAMPTFVFFVNGQEVNRVQGANQAAIDAGIQQLNQAAPARPFAGGGRTLGSAPAPAKKAEEWFVGGGTGSGQAVLSRPEGGSSSSGAGGAHQDVVKGLFDQARSMGAIPVGPGEPGTGAAADPQAFTGSGRRLGYTPGPSPAMKPIVKETVSVKISFYSNGFTINDGPLRRMDDPESQAVLQAIQRGVVPREIAAAHPGKEIDVDLENRTNEAYVEKFQAFKGAGNRLSTAASSSATPAAAASAPSSSASSSSAKPDNIVCEGDVCRRVPAAAASSAPPASAPVASASDAAAAGQVRVMLQLPNGSRQPFSLPASTTVGALRIDAKKLSGLSSCLLLVRNGTATETLTDDSLDLVASRCANAVVFVKPVA